LIAVILCQLEPDSAVPHVADQLPPVTVESTVTFAPSFTVVLIA
jgi:hypothetical protein